MQRQEIEKFFLLGYILLNGMFVGRTINAIMATANGYNAAINIMINGAIVALTAQRAIHYYKLTKEK